jgi:ABC-2 type transport system ATP-binding protein
MEHAVLAEGLVKVFGRVTAMDGLDLTIPPGRVLALLGPNGAGKTTCVRVLSTLLRPDAGRAEVAGIDVLAHPDRVRQVIGLSGQYAAVDQDLTGRENLDLVGRLYHLGRRTSRARADELLEQFRLQDAADRPVRTYSGGMRRRLDLAGALVARPRVLFLDEPTTGLDPRGRIGMWTMLTELVAEGTTVLLTTQYLEEADQLADQIVVIDDGRVIAEGTGDELKTRVGGETIDVVLAGTAELEKAIAVLSGIGDRTPMVQAHLRRVSIRIGTGISSSQSLMRALRGLDAAGLSPLDIGVRRPTLDDVFLSLTGRPGDRGDVESDEADHDTGRDDADRDDASRTDRQLREAEGAMER